LTGGEGSIWDKAIPLSFFGGEEVPKFLGVDVCNTTLCFSLTHLLVDNDEKEWDTAYLGQKTNENLEPLFVDDVKKVFQYDGTQKTKDSEESYIIDKVIIQGLIKNDIKITFFDENEELANPLWTTKVQSQGKYTNSLRNWTTEITTGGWNDKYVKFKKKFTWPEYPPYGIIENQKPKDSPYIKPKNVSGTYEINIKDNTSEYFNDTGDQYKKVLWNGKIKINYADLDPTQEKIYDEATLKENVLLVSLSLSYSFSLLPKSSSWELGRINTSNNININVDAKDFFGNKTIQFNIFNYSNKKDWYDCDTIDFLEKENLRGVVSGTQWFEKYYSIACNERSVFYYDEFWHRAGFLTYLKINGCVFGTDYVEISASLMVELLDLDHLGHENTRPFITFYLLQQCTDENFYNAKIHKESKETNLTISCALEQINFEIKQDDDEEE